MTSQMLCQKNQALQLKTNGVIMLCLVRAISHFRKAATDEYRTMWEQCLAGKKEETCPNSTFSTKSSHAVTRPEAEMRYRSLHHLSYDTSPLTESHINPWKYQKAYIYPEWLTNSKESWLQCGAESVAIHYTYLCIGWLMAQEVFLWWDHVL